MMKSVFADICLIVYLLWVPMNVYKWMNMITDNNLLDALPGFLLSLPALETVHRHGNHNYFKSTFMWYHTDVNLRVIPASAETQVKPQVCYFLFSTLLIFKSAGQTSRMFIRIVVLVSVQWWTLWVGGRGSTRGQGGGKLGECIDQSYIPWLKQTWLILQYWLFGFFAK